MVEENQIQIKQGVKKSIWKKWWFWVIAVFVIIIIVQGRGNRSVKDVERLSNSIDLANQATIIANKAGASGKTTEDDIRAMVNYYKQALEEAHQVDIEKLNRDYAGFGDHYRDEFIRGIELFIEGFEQSDPEKFLAGQILLNRWEVWFYNNIDEIRKL